MPTREQILDWIKQRAQSDVQMLEAAAASTAVPRTAAAGETRDRDGQDAVAVVLTRDHDQVTALLEELSTIPGRNKGGTRRQIERRESIVATVTTALTTHEAREQEHLWPAVRDGLADGDEWARQAIQQEQEAAATLAALGKADPDGDEFDELVEKLGTDVRKHVALEERLFLVLAEKWPEDKRLALGRKLQRAERATDQPAGGES